MDRPLGEFGVAWGHFLCGISRSRLCGISRSRLLQKTLDSLRKTHFRHPQISKKGPCGGLPLRPLRGASRGLRRGGGRRPPARGGAERRPGGGIRRPRARCSTPRHQPRPPESYKPGDTKTPKKACRARFFEKSCAPAGSYP